MNLNHDRSWWSGAQFIHVVLNSLTTQWSWISTSDCMLSFFAPCVIINLWSQSTSFALSDMNVASFDVRYCAEEPNNETDPSSNRVQLNRAAVQPWVHFGRIALSCFALPCPILPCFAAIRCTATSCLNTTCPFKWARSFQKKYAVQNNLPQPPSPLDTPGWPSYSVL